MKHEACPSLVYPCMDTEAAAEGCEMHPFFDPPSWRDGFARGYAEGRTDGEHLAAQALRADLLQHLQTLAGDLRLGLRHDMTTPLEAVCAMTHLVEGTQVRVTPRRAGGEWL
jgi:hypothetical protein